MKNGIVDVIIATVLLAIGALLIKAFQLNFGGLFIDYVFEAVFLIVFLIIAVVLACKNSTKTKIQQLKVEKSENEAELLKVKAERDSYKDSLEELLRVDDEAQILRSIIKYKNSKIIS